MTKEELLAMLSEIEDEAQRAEIADKIMAEHESTVKKLEKAKRARTANLNNRQQRAKETLKAIADAQTPEEIDALEIEDDTLKQVASTMKERLDREASSTNTLKELQEGFKALQAANQARAEREENDALLAALDPQMKRVNEDMRASVLNRVKPFLGRNAGGGLFVKDDKGAPMFDGDKPITLDDLFADVRNGGFTGDANPSAFRIEHQGSPTVPNGMQEFDPSNGGTAEVDPIFDEFNDL